MDFLNAVVQAWTKSSATRTDLDDFLVMMSIMSFLIFLNAVVSLYLVFKGKRE